MLPLKDNIPTVRFPVITIALILINVAMFFGFQHAHWSGRGFAVSPSNTVKYAFIPYKLTHLGKKCGKLAGDVVCEPVTRRPCARVVNRFGEERIVCGRTDGTLNGTLWLIGAVYSWALEPQTAPPEDDDDALEPPALGSGDDGQPVPALEGASD